MAYDCNSNGFHDLDDGDDLNAGRGLMVGLGVSIALWMATILLICVASYR